MIQNYKASKRLLSILLAIVMCLTMLPITAFAAEGDPCKNKDKWGCTGTYTAAGYCNVCSQDEAGYICAHDLTSQGSGWVCTKCDKFYDICPHLEYHIQTNKCFTCGACRHYFTEDFPCATNYTSNDSLTHTVTVRCSACALVVSETKEDHTILSEATCLKKAVCEQCGEFDASTYYHENPTPTYTESATNSVMHEIRYECCGAVTTEEHKDEDGDSDCDACGSTNFHTHSFVYTYQRADSMQMEFDRQHYVNKACAGCNESFERTVEACSLVSNCQGVICSKCGFDTNLIGDSNNHASMEIIYTNNGDGTHTGVYVCCGAEYETAPHDDDCERCPEHVHSFEYTYTTSLRDQHKVNKFCTGCDESFAQTTEACSFVSNCQGIACAKCGKSKTSGRGDPNVHASTEITYTDNGDGTHSGVHACCGAEYVTDEAHTYGDNNTCVCGAVQEIISVNITWGEMSFTYTDGEWNPETHTYAEGNWTPDNENGNVITVTNNGNVAVNVAFTYDKTVTEVEGSFTENSPFVLATNESKEIKLILNGKPSSTFEDTQLGTVTVKITLPEG